MTHRCLVPNCDGTHLGHDLAAEFPEETARIDRELARLAEPKDGLRVNPANLQVEAMLNVADTAAADTLASIKAAES